MSLLSNKQFDWTNDILMELLSELIKAYKDPREAQFIVEMTGIAEGTYPKGINDMRQQWRENLKVLAKQGKLRTLVEKILKDPTVSSYHSFFARILEIDDEERNEEQTVDNSRNRGKGKDKGGESTIFDDTQDITDPTFLAIPKPDTGMENQAVIFSQLATSSRSDSLSEMISVDLGMLLGVNRGSYAAMISGLGSGKQLFHSLVAIERTLLDTQIKMFSEIVLPVRWWVYVEMRKKPTGPRSFKDLQECAIEHDVRVSYLIENGLPVNHTIGIFVRFDEGASYLQTWCDALSELIPGVDIGVILYSNNWGNMPDPKIELPICRLQRAELLGANEAHLMPLTVIEKLKSTAGDFNKLVSLSLGRSNSTNINQFSQILEVADLSESIEYDQAINCCRVVAYVDTLDDCEAIVQELLELVRLYSSEYLSNLIFALATSSHANVRSMGLKFALSPESDMFLLRAWVSGTGFDPDQWPDKSTIRKIIKSLGGSTGLQNLQLALLHEYWPLHQSVNLQPILEILPPLPSSMQQFDLYKAAKSEISITEIFRKYDGRKFQYGLMSGINRIIDLKDLVRFLHPQYHGDSARRLALSLVPSHDTLSELIQQPLEVRFLFGLCTSQEWNTQIMKDPAWHNRVINSRGNFPLLYKE